MIDILFVFALTIIFTFYTIDSVKKGKHRKRMRNNLPADPNGWLLFRELDFKLKYGDAESEAMFRTDVLDINYAKGELIHILTKNYPNDAKIKFSRSSIKAVKCVNKN